MSKYRVPNNLGAPLYCHRWREFQTVHRRLRASWRAVPEGRSHGVNPGDIATVFVKRLSGNSKPSQAGVGQMIGGDLLSGSQGVRPVASSIATGTGVAT
jgi:hypothetical protein